MYSLDSYVRYSECDSDAILSTYGLVNYLQDCSIFHTETIGGGIGTLHSQGYAWYIAAWQIRIKRMPRFAEHIQVETWVPKTGGLITSRNFVLDSLGDDGQTERLVEVDSNWFLYDLSQNQPVHPPEEVVAPYLGEDAPALDMPRTSMKLKLTGEVSDAPTRVIDEGLLDTNKHVNNANYIEIAWEAAGLEGQPSCIEAIYRQAAVLGDVMEPKVGRDGNVVTVDLSSPDGVCFCMVRFTF